MYLSQLFVGLAVSLLFFALQMQARPYRDAIDDLLASGMQLATVSIFISCVLLKVRVLLEIVEDTLSPALWSSYSYGSVTTLMACMGSVVGSLFAFSLVVLQSVVQAQSTPTLRMRGQRAPMQPPLLATHLRYHFFISHGTPARIRLPSLFEATPSVAFCCLL